MAEKVAAQAKLAGDQFSQSAAVIMHLSMCIPSHSLPGRPRVFWQSANKAVLFLACRVCRTYFWPGCIQLMQHYAMFDLSMPCLISVWNVFDIIYLKIRSRSHWSCTKTFFQWSCPNFWNFYYIIKDIPETRILLKPELYCNQTCYLLQISTRTKTNTIQHIYIGGTCWNLLILDIFGQF